MKAGQVWQGQEYPLYTIICVVNLEVVFGFPFNGSVKGTKFGDSSSIVGYHMGVGLMLCQLLMCLNKILVKACTGMTLPLAMVSSLHLRLPHWFGPSWAGICTGLRW